MDIKLNSTIAAEKQCRSSAKEVGIKAQTFYRQDFITYYNKQKDNKKTILSLG